MRLSSSARSLALRSCGVNVVDVDDDDVADGSGGGIEEELSLLGDGGAVELSLLAGKTIPSKDAVLFRIGPSLSFLLLLLLLLLVVVVVVVDRPVVLRLPRLSLATLAVAPETELSRFPIVTNSRNWSS